MMFRLLLKKQLTEIFRSYFYDVKKNRARSAGSVAGMFVLFAVLLLIGAGMFFLLAFTLCEPLFAAGCGWLYFLIIGGIALFLGIIGSAFNTYNMMYSSKDNDLLLSMPIQPSAIVGSRVACVYLLGLLYSAIVLVPAYIVYFIKIHDPLGIAGFIVFTAVISVTVMSLSCLLGWVIAKVAGRLKNKSIITVLLALAFIVVYYFVYFRIQKIISELIENAALWGGKIRGSAHVVYMFGRAGEGDPLSMLVYAAFAAVLFFLVFLLLRKTFYGITAATSKAKKIAYREKTVKAAGQGKALYRRELDKFLSSPMYMLNWGIAALFLLVLGGLVIWRGRAIFTGIRETLDIDPGLVAVFACAIIAMTASMGSGISAVSVSLEGKNLWIVKSLPVKPEKVLGAKLMLGLSVYMLPLVFCSVSVAAVLEGNFLLKLLVAVMPVLFYLFTSYGGLLIGLKMPELNWTNEMIPIKQGRSVTICLLGSWGLAVITALPYLFLSRYVNGAVYLTIVSVLLAAGTAVCRKCLLKYGTRMFEDL